MKMNYLTRNDVDAITEKLAATGNPQFNVLWREIPREEQPILSALAEGIHSTGRTSLDLMTIETMFRNAGVSIPRPKLRGHMESAMRRELIELTEDFQARFQLELFHLWIRHQCPLGQVLTELEESIRAGETPNYSNWEWRSFST